MFSNFVKDKENHFVFDLLNHLPENTPTFNPLFIYGAHNSGKSHLLKAAFNHYQALGLKCLYVDAETFSEHVIYAMKNQAMNEFRKTYRICDMLFFDDVHKLAHKTATQEEFFHTFNSLQMATKSIVMASLTPASFLKDIEPRLISRFEWGLSIELPVLNKEHFPVLINTLSGSLGLDISKENKKTLLENFSLDPGSLIKAIHAISLRSHLDQDHSEKHAQVTLDDLKNQKKELTADDITLKTSNFFGLKPKDIRGPSQTKPLAFPRQLTMYLIRKHLNLPYKKMGEYFSRDHSTVMASITIIDQKLKNFEEETMNAVKRIEWDLKN
jgi:chromosomal replication initiator protein